MQATAPGWSRQRRPHRKRAWRLCPFGLLLRVARADRRLACRVHAAALAVPLTPWQAAGQAGALLDGAERTERQHRESGCARLNAPGERSSLAASRLQREAPRGHQSLECPSRVTVLG